MATGYPPITDLGNNFILVRKRLLLLLVGSYSLFISVWFVGRFLFSDQFWWLAVANSGALFLFWPLPLLWITAVFSRSKKLLIWLCLPTAVFLLLYGELFLPQVQPTVQGLSLRVMTFNLLYSNQDVHRIAEAIHIASPDLVGVQEMTQFHADQLGLLLADEYPYQDLRPGNRYGDVGLFSRYPIETADDLPLPPRHLAMQAMIAVNGRILHVFVVHLMPNQLGTVPLPEVPKRVRERYTTRLAEITLLAEAIRPLTAPVLLLCDCNLTETSLAYAKLDAFLDDSFRETGWGLGLTSSDARWLPTQRIDYVWYSAGITAVRSVVGPDGRSDHFPVVADLILAD